MYDLDLSGVDIASSSSLSDSAISGVLAGMTTTSWVISIAVSILILVAMWKIFEKAGKPGWAAIVPVYNIVVLFQIVGLNPLLIILLLIPVVNFVAMPVLTILSYVKLAKVFGKSGGYAVGLIFLGVVFLPMLAFSDAEYQGV